jgi:hypothetical protein
MDLELEFVSGGDVQALVERPYNSPPGVIARAQAIVATNWRAATLSLGLTVGH